MKVKNLLVMLVATGVVIFGQAKASALAYVCERCGQEINVYNENPNYPGSGLAYGCPGTGGPNPNNSWFKTFGNRHYWQFAARWGNWRERQRAEEERKRHEAEEARRLEREFNSLVAKGDSLYNEKDYLKAIDSYKSASKIDSSQINKFYNNLVSNGNKLKEQGQGRAALDYYKKALTMKQEDVVIEKAGEILFEQANSANDLTDDINFFKTLDSVTPDNARVNMILGIMYTASEDYEQGVVCLESAKKLLLPEPLVYTFLGLCHLHLNNLDKAIEDLKTTTKLSPKDADAHYYLGVAYVQAKDYKSAKKSLNKALKLNPNHVEAKKVLQGIPKGK